MAVSLPGAEVRARASNATQTLWRNASKRVSRTKEILRQNLGRVEKTDDGAFEQFVDDFNRGSQKISKLHKHLENYAQSLRAMNNARTALFDVFKECYEDGFTGRAESLDSIDGIAASTKELIKDIDKSINNIVAFKSQLPTVKTKIEKRNKKLLDFDAWRHEMIELQNAKKKMDLEKIAKAEERAAESKRLYESLNIELYDLLPDLHDRRIPIFAKTFGILFKGEATYHDRNSKFRHSLAESLSKLNEEAVVGTYATPRLAAPELSLPERREAPPRKPKNNTENINDDGDDSNDGSGTEADNNITNNNVENGDDDKVTEAEMEASPSESTSSAAPAAAAAEKEAAPLPTGVISTRVVTHRYDGNDDDELHLSIGDVVNCVELENEEELDEGWCFGYVAEKLDKKGLFPLNFTEPT